MPCEIAVVGQNLEVCEVEMETVAVFSQSVDVTEVDLAVTEILQGIELVEVSQGLKGDPGDDAESMQVTAGQNISALRPIVIIGGQGFHADSSNSTHIGKVVGVSTTSATTGNLFTLATDGSRITDASWNWTGDTVFVGVGLLAQTPPLTVFLQSIGAVVNTDSIVVLVGDPTER